MKKVLELILGAAFVAFVYFGFIAGDGQIKQTIEARDYVTIVDKEFVMSGSGNFISVKGTIKNTSKDKAITNILARYECSDDKGSVINSSEGYISTSPIGPGQSKVLEYTVRHNGATGTLHRIFVKDAKFGKL